MSQTNKTRFEVQTIIKSAITKALTDLSISGWDIREFANPSLQKGNKLILLNYVRNDRVGWQSGSDVVENQQFKHREQWIECQTWHLHIIAKRTDSTTDSSIIAEDVANNIIAWFNGVGLAYLRNKGVSINVISNSQILVYDDNSELYQKRIVVPIRFNVPKVLLSNQVEMLLGEANTYPI